MAFGLAREAVDHREAEPGALPDRLGGEERIEGARLHGRRHADAGVGDRQADILARRRRRAAPPRSGASRCAFAVSIVSMPPSGIASRALIARLSSALSSWCGSQKVPHSPPAATISSRIVSPMVRRSSSSIEATSWLTLTGFGSSGWRRANASRRWVSDGGAVRRGLGQRRVALDRRRSAPARCASASDQAIR